MTARKRVAAFYIGMLIGLVIIFTNLTPLQQFTAAIGAVFLSPQGGTNPAPPVIPALHEWHGDHGFFMLSASSHIVVDPAYASQLNGTAQVFQSDLASVTKRTFPIVSTISPASGDFFLTLNNVDTGIGNEGYLFQVGDTTVISAHTATGVFYGTRTALQILVQDPAKTYIPRGVARDYPQYGERGFMLDAGRKFFTLSALEDYVKFMAWYKMNDFHIHFNDNVPGGGDSADWMHQYAAFRLNSPKFPGLAATDGSYTKQDILALEAVASKYHVTITPEIDMPAHDLAFTQYRPDLASQTDSKEFLDLSNPGTYTFLNSIWNEFIPWFTSKQVDIGADEYTPAEADSYRQFINTYDTFLRSKGKTVRMWGSLSKMQGSVPVNTNITIENWNNTWSNPVDMVNAGFSIINADDSLLYIVPRAGYYNDYLNTQLIYDQWTPNIFSLSDPTLNLQPGNSHLLGGMFSEWNDKLGSVVSDADVYARVQPAMETVSEKLWNTSNGGMNYDQFLQIALRVSTAPGTNLPE